MKINWLFAALLVVFWGVCVAFYPSLPDTLITHWNISGQPDGYSSKLVASIVMPLMPLGLYLLMTFLPKVDPRKENYEKFGGTYEIIKVAVCLVMVIASSLPIITGIGYHVNVSFSMRLTISLLFIILGNYMGKIRYNYFTGFRLPWTLANEVIWQRTHRLTGRLMVLFALISLVGLVLPDKLGIPLMMGCIFLPLIIGGIYSYLEYRKINTVKS